MLAVDAPRALDTEALTLIRDENVRASGKTITEYMREHGVEGGVALEESGSAKDVLETDSGRKYAVGGMLAKGGMGAILNCRDLNIRRSVAMKVMLNPKSVGPPQVLRFIEEAQVTGQLEHPGIVPVHELGVDTDDNVFYTMKFVHGRTLKDILAGIREGAPETVAAFPLFRLLTIFQRVCETMAYAHHRQVIHRDLKPENIMIGDFGEVYVMDWGLAKVLVNGEGRSVEGGIPAAGSDSGAKDGSGHTEDVVNSARGDSLTEGMNTLDGAVMGTPHYMAPEQARGKIAELDARTDIYALGGILYEMLSLETTVDEKSLMALLLKVAKGDIRALPVDADPAARPHCPNGRIPAPLAAVAMKALATEPADRYAGADQLCDDTRAYLDGFATIAEEASLGRQLALLIRRHRGAVVAAVLLFLAISTGLVVSLVQRQQAVLARDAADAARQEAVEARHQAEENEAKASAARAEAEYNGYRSSIELAGRALEEYDTEQAMALLKACPEQYRYWEWGYLTAKSRRQDTSHLRFGGQNVCVSSDGSLFASGGGRNTVHVIDSKTGAERLVLQAESTPQSLVFFAKDTRLAVLCGSPIGGAFQIFDVATGEKVVDRPGNYDYGCGVAISRDGNVAVTAAGHKILAPATVWNLETGEQMGSLGEPGKSRKPAWSPDGKLVAVPTGSQIHLFDFTSRRLIARLTGHRRTVRAVAFAPDSSRLASVSDDGTGRVWNLETGDVEHILSGAMGQLTDTLFVGGGKYILGCTVRGVLLAWKAADGMLVNKTSLHSRLITDVAEIPDHSQVLVGFSNFTPMRMDLQALLLGSGDGQLVPVFHRGQRGLLTSPNGNAVIAGGGLAAFAADGTIGTFRCFDAAGNCRALAWSPDSSMFATSATLSTDVSVWSNPGGKLLARFAGQERKESGPIGASACFLPGNQLLATGWQTEGQIWVWDVVSGKRIREIPVDISSVSDLQLSPDGSTLVAGGDGPGHLGAWNIRDWSILDWPSPRMRIERLAFSPNGQLLVLAAKQGLELWDVKNRKRLWRSEKGHTDRVTAVCFSPDGQRIASSSTDRRVLLWDPLTGKQVARLKHSEYAYGVIFSPDGGSLLVWQWRAMVIRKAAPWQ